ncbi:hypothetical protein L1987_57863 [Smallanthus sonchifolius]|uniref:Uncharacterized protein n=1 Tax=Smallanthus sonchifolius TaxID=185202 RepID=A0ACB9DDX7_9ASTR|nr:hypothetical protein L1987_57863 [Smallanthus sonchifolius]
MFNTDAGGHIMYKLELDECEEMFESFALAEHQQPSTRSSNPSARAPAYSPRGMHQVNPDTSVAASLEACSAVGGYIARSLKEKQSVASAAYKSSNASVIAVSILSNREEERVEKEASHEADYGIPSVEEVKNIDWRARFAEIDDRMLEEPELNAVSAMSRRAEEKESPPVVEEIVTKKPVEKAEEK